MKTLLLVALTWTLLLPAFAADDEKEVDRVIQAKYAPPSIVINDAMEME